MDEPASPADAPTLALARGDRFYRFFDLPAELREQILRHVCHSPRGYLVGVSLGLDGDGGGALEPEPPRARAPLALMHACAQLCREASAVFYEQNAFHVNASAGTRRSLAPLVGRSGRLGLFGSSTPALAARRRLRRVVLYLRRVGGAYRDVLGPALDDMALSGRLRDLEVRFWPGRTAGAGLGRHSRAGLARDNCKHIIHNPPFQALLRLLADPYLERAVVRVSGVHWRLWCPFHDQGVVEEDGAVSPGDVPNSESPEWVDIRVEELVRAYGGAGGSWSILRIGERQ